MPKIATAVNFLLVLAAILVPRLMFKRNDGLAGAAAVALIVLCSLGLSLVIGIVAAVSAWRKSKRTGAPMAISGFAPLGVFLLGIAGLFVLSQIPR